MQTGSSQKASGAVSKIIERSKALPVSLAFCVASVGGCASGAMPAGYAPFSPQPVAPVVIDDGFYVIPDHSYFDVSTGTIIIIPLEFYQEGKGYNIIPDRAWPYRGFADEFHYRSVNDFRQSQGGWKERAFFQKFSTDQNHVNEQRDSYNRSQGHDWPRDRSFHVIQNGQFRHGQQPVGTSKPTDPRTGPEDTKRHPDKPKPPQKQSNITVSPYGSLVVRLG